MRIIEQHIDDETFSVESFAREAGFSRSQLHRKLTAITGQSPTAIIRNTRLQRAKELLEKKADNVSQIAFRVGFSSPAYFSRCYKEAFGVSPSEV